MIIRHRMTLMADRVLDWLDWFDQLAVASLRAIGRGLVEGFAAHGLSVGCFDPDVSRYPASSAQTSRETEVVILEQLRTNYENVDDLIASLSDRPAQSPRPVSKAPAAAKSH
jgi:hypothetical protein